MAIVKLILNIISSAILLVFGIGMFAAGIYDLKHNISPRALSILCFTNGALMIGMSVGFWVW